MFVSDTAQFPAVCPGLSAIARIQSPIFTATHPSVPTTDIFHRSHFSIAPAVPDPPEEGNMFEEAS